MEFFIIIYIAENKRVAQEPITTSSSSFLQLTVIVPVIGVAKKKAAVASFQNFI